MNDVTTMPTGQLEADETDRLISSEKVEALPFMTVEADAWARFIT